MRNETCVRHGCGNAKGGNDGEEETADSSTTAGGWLGNRAARRRELSHAAPAESTVGGKTQPPVLGVETDIVRAFTPAHPKPPRSWSLRMSSSPPTCNPRVAATVAVGGYVMGRRWGVPGAGRSAQGSERDRCCSRHSDLQVGQDSCDGLWCYLVRGAQSLSNPFTNGAKTGQDLDARASRATREGILPYARTANTRLRLREVTRGRDQAVTKVRNFGGFVTDGGEQLRRSGVCGPGGRGFKSPRSPLI